MSDADVNQVIGWDKSLIASDSLHYQTKKPHPRLFGTFPRVFSKCVREDKILTLEQAVRKVTSFPAQRFRLGKRGLLAPGYEADVVVFDPDEISDRATYEEPNQFPDGISHVLVNGRITVEHGTHRRAREGRWATARGNC
jgi:N-acyl-D-amino-acid deacylase